MKQIIADDNITAIILAAGKSERMGFPKPFLNINQNSPVTFLQQIVNQYEKINCQIVVVFNPDNFEFYKLLTNQFLDNHIVAINNLPASERIFSIRTGLEKTPKSNYCFIQNCDNPYVTVDLLNTIINHREKNAYVIPIKNGRGAHPILICNTIIQIINNLQNFTLTLKDILKESHKVEIQVDDDNLFLNINNPDDYKNFLQQSTL